MPLQVASFRIRFFRCDNIVFGLFMIREHVIDLDSSTSVDQSHPASHFTRTMWVIPLFCESNSVFVEDPLVLLWVRYLLIRPVRNDL